MPLSVRLRSTDRDVTSAPPLRIEPPRPVPAAPPARAHVVRHLHTEHVPLGNLRAFVTVLVVLHHVVLAHNAMLPPQAASLLEAPRWWTAVPVVAHERSIVWTIVNGLNDVYFMSLMFLLSGLFVWRSLEAKGTGEFLRARVRRLGWGFAIMAAVLAPIAYYPAFLATGSHGLGAFARVWMQLGAWPAGPAWFLWVLLAFDACAALAFTVARRRPAAPDIGHRIIAGPLPAAAAIAAFSTAAYLALMVPAGPFAWAAVGPFTVQTSRVLLYAVYFAAGVVLGARRTDEGWLADGGPLARRWAWWVAAAIVAAAGLMAATIGAGTTPSLAATTIIGSAFTLSCLASSFAMLAAFLRWGGSNALAWRSLRANAYGIYMVHFAIAAWLEYALLAWPAGAIVKGFAIFAVTLGLSWAAARVLRELPGLARVL